AITGSTISSKAYCDAIEKAYLSLMKNILKRCDFKLASDKNKTCVLQDIALLKKVLPPFDNDPFKEVKKINDIEYYPASKNNISVGYAIKTFADGYSGPIWILTGILPDGKINGVHLLQHTETIGYGDKLTSPEFLNQFKGKVIGKCMMEVKKDGGEIDAISGSTVSSRAFCEAIIKAAELFNTNLNSVKETVASNDSLSKEPTKPIAPTTLFKLSNKSIFTNVIPEFNNDPLQEFQSINGMDVYTGKMNGTITGYAITAVSKKGFGGKVFMLVGFKPDGTIHNTAYVSHNETPSFIDMIEESEYRLQFNGKNPVSFNVAIKSEGGEVDAVSGVTYTSRAISETIQKAYSTYIKIKK
ncbi:MAG TPA: FMN-binding protein, partial [Bacteroidales bacterium]|nr:FMN-binding protein [Bacteroidales bacterium]